MIQSISESPATGTPNASPICFCAICSPGRGAMEANVEGSLHRKQMGSIVGQRRAVARFRRAAETWRLASISRREARGHAIF